MPNAKLREKGIDGPRLYASSATFDTQFCRIDMIISIRNDQWQGIEMLNDLLMRLGLRKPLQQFLENDTSAYDRSRSECAFEFIQLGDVRRRVATQSQ